MNSRLEQRVRAIEARNRSVEKDKAWEVSPVRRSSIAVLTYLSIVAYLIATSQPDPFITALIPVIGYIVSTLILGGVRKYLNK